MNTCGNRQKKARFNANQRKHTAAPCAAARGG
jgi:predicted RNA-binding Zn ribbon-like protein